MGARLKAVPVYGGFEPSASCGRCSEGRIGRNREYCKRQRSKTTIFQPAFVAANVMSSRKGNGLKLPSATRCSPSDNPPKLSPGWNKVVLLTFVRNSPCSCPFSVSLHPPQAALNSEPRKRWSLLVRFTSLHIKPALEGEVGFAKQKPEGLHRDCSCLSQPLSQTFGSPAPSVREPFGALYKLTY